ncbi:MAG: polysaccharide deacetylase family protein [Bradyrhizobium sp.]
MVFGLAMAALAPASATECPHPEALSTFRVLAVDPHATPRVGRKQFPQTLPLAAMEVVLTFDDGPRQGTTERVLDALKRECVRATFFLLGRNAAEAPALVRRERAEAEIDRGIAAVETALQHEQPAPFFRFPGFASSPALLDRLASRGLIVFGADLWASDWNQMTPGQQLQLVLARLAKNRGGIVLFHDTKAQTAAMLPAFLRELKARGYRIVHVVPAPAPAEDGPP